jgi:peptidyl-prolyl cis-trans isomerase C
MARACARHILVATEESCDELKTQIEAGADFAILARDHSQCPSGKQGGDLGEFGPGEMVREFDEVVFSAEVVARHERPNYGHVILCIICDAQQCAEADAHVINYSDVENGAAS